jgi:hypothetical protein
VILRILTQESPDSELLLKIYGEKKFWTLKLELWKSQGIFGNIEYWEGLCVKRLGYNWNFGGTQG